METENNNLQNKIVNYAALDKFRQLITEKYSEEIANSANNIINERIGNLTVGTEDNLRQVTIEEVIGTPISFKTEDNRIIVISLKDLITAETSRAQNSESTLQGSIDTLNGQINTLDSQIKTLNGNSTVSGSVDKKIADAKSDLTTEINKKADLATTLAGYEIGDAYTKTEVNDLLTAKGNDITALQTRVGMDDTSGLSLRIKTNENNIAANKAAIDVLNGEATVEGSVKKQVADAIAGVVANAPADFDTLKEVADWIANDTTGAAAMQTNIAALKTKVATVEEGAEVNQNAYSNVKVGEVTLSAANKTDTIEFVAGDNVTLAAADGKVTITAKDTVEASGIGMSGYSKGSETAINTSDTVLSAVGKLEARVDAIGINLANQLVFASTDEIESMFTNSNLDSLEQSI